MKRELNKTWQGMGEVSWRRQVSEIEEFRTAAANETVMRVVAVILPAEWKSTCGWQKSKAER
jgi:hypothetical protein